MTLIRRSEIPDHEIPKELLDLQREYESLIDEAEATCSKLSHTQFNWKPGSHQWSVGQCLDHLNVSHGKYLRSIRRALNDALPRGEAQLIRSTLLGKLYRWLLEPPVRKRLPSPKNFVPPADEREVQTVLEEFRKTHRELIAEIRRSSETDLNRVTVSSPVSKRLRLNLYDAFGTLAAHGRRHLWQSGRVRSAPGFPAG